MTEDDEEKRAERRDRAISQLHALTDFFQSNSGGVASSLDDLDANQRYVLMSIVEDLVGVAYAAQGAP